MLSYATKHRNVVGAKNNDCLIILQTTNTVHTGHKKKKAIDVTAIIG